MPFAVGASLALHVLAFQLPAWKPAVADTADPAIQVEFVPLPPAKPEVMPKPRIRPVEAPVRQAARPVAPRAPALLAGGAEMSDEAEASASLSVAAPARAEMSMSPARPTGQGMPGPAAAASSDAEPGAVRGIPATRTKRLALADTAPAKGGLPWSGGAGPGQADAGGGLSSVAAAPRAAALRTADGQTTLAETGHPGQPAVAASSGAGVDSQRIDLAHAQTGAPELSKVASAARPAGGATQAAGAAESAPVVSANRAGPPRLPSGLAVIEGGKALDLNALDGTSSGFIFQAALADDGSRCFRYSAGMRRNQQQGLVVLRIRVDREGRAERIEVRSGSGDAQLDGLAVDQARGCARFVVKNNKGRPVAATLDLPIRYRLNDD